ncbi:helix-turn-helix domain-containing protein [Paraclostridium sordellii]|uniref:helix-turn-helix domain-containing protein n=1 Tax=Paraclostridium sordellii TaxID=1505 RepID=UPI0005E23A99|nr:helix-turn-helix transcriptional regulator [Paeniclostridium sordellii]CEN94313.1 Helix-turn-helix domain [[Clostridium] sordellii] [Paeniclostridium sordellii]CEN94662.1 Helix-turn-helix domain [[Clostridium] sordellii] [Paeniclostridium sordellii]
MNLQLLEEKIKVSLYTTEELASMLDISRTMLWRYRTGQAKMSFDTAVQIATLLEIDIQELIK